MYNVAKLRKKFETEGIKLDVSMNPMTLGSSYWKKARGKELYLRKALDSWYKPQYEDRKTPYGDLLIGWASDFIQRVEAVIRPEFLKNERVAFSKSIQNDLLKTKSYFEPRLLAKSISEYHNDREFSFDVPSQTIEIAKKMGKLYDKQIMLLCKLPDELQTKILLSKLEPDVNIGYDLWVPQSKKTYAMEFSKACNHFFGISIPFTVEGIFRMVNIAIEKKFYPCFTSFYRTKNREAVRAVFGGSIFHKAVGCLISAAKHPSFKDDSERVVRIEGMKDIEYPKVGELPWVSWIDWDLLFNKIIQLDFDNLEAVGEDIIKFDSRVIYADLSWLKNISSKVTPLWSWILDCMQESDVLFGPFRTRDAFFVSGHPFTSEFGSYVHHALSFLCAEEMGAHIQHGVWQSDDNLVFYDAFDEEVMVNFYEKLGYPIKTSATHIFSKDGMVSYLKNWIGYIFNDQEISFCGDCHSRYINMIHREKGSPEVFFTLANDVNVDALIGQLASYSVNAANIVKPLFERLQATDIGREAMRALVRLQNGEAKLEIARSDLSVGFRPSWLVSII
jgi:hypothetical protein